MKRLFFHLKPSYLWLILFILLLVPSQAAFADYTQQQLYQLGIATYDVDGGGAACGSGSTTLSGGDNLTKIWNYFRGKGLGAAGTAGIMGNMHAESGFNPAAHQTDGAWDDMGTDYNQAVGLVQWDGGRRPAMIKYAESQGATLDELKKGDDKTLGIELDYVWQELNGSYSSTLQTIQKETDPAQAAFEFHQGYEGSNDLPDAIRQNRMDPAVTIYNQFSGRGTGTNPTSTSSGGGCASLSPDCTAASGTAKILCAAKAYDTVSYQMGAGHNGAANWHKGCPTIGPSCYLDCSGLVNIAVYDAFGVDMSDDTNSERTDTQYWKQIPFSQIQPGDLVQPEPSHVEIVDHVVGNRVYAFAAHTDGIEQSQQVGEWTNQPDIDGPGSVYLHYVGPGV